MRTPPGLGAGSAATDRPVAPTGTNPGSERYSDTGNRFSIVGPSGWVARPSPSANPVLTSSLPGPDDAAGSPFPVSMNVFVNATGDGLDATVAAAREQLPAALAGYRAVTDEPVGLAGGARGQLLGGTYTQNGLMLRNLQLITVAAGMVYVVTATAPAASFERYRDLVRASMTTLVPSSG